MVPLLVVLGVACVLVLKQPDMGTALVLACIALALFYAGGVPLRPVLKVLVGVAVLGVALGLAEPYRRARLLSFLNPFAHAQGSGYQVVQSLVGLGSGRLFGLGAGRGPGEVGLLPNAHTDFIFSVIGEQAGLVGALVVLGLFAALAWYGLRAAGRAPDRFGSLMAVAATCWITSQAVINIGAVIGLLPVTGIPLPFISFGGSSLVITMVAGGVLVNVAAHERRPPYHHTPPSPVPGPGTVPVTAGPAAGRRRRRRRAGDRPALRPGGRGRHRRPSGAGRHGGEGPGPGAGRHRPVEIVGSRRGLEGDLLRAAGWPVTTLPGRGSARSFGPRPGWPTSGPARRPGGGRGDGGGPGGPPAPGRGGGHGRYACVPVALAAVVWACPWCWSTWMPCPGRPAGWWAGSPGPRRWPSRGTPLAQARVTGAPVRPEIVAAAHPDAGARQPGRTAWPCRRTGSRWASWGDRWGPTLNEAALALATLWAGRADVALYHVVGRRDAEWVAAAAPGCPTAAWPTGRWPTRTGWTASTRRPTWWWPGPGR